MLVSSQNVNFSFNVLTVCIFFNMVCQNILDMQKCSILKETSPEYSLEGLMLKLKLQYLVTWCEELTHWKRSYCWEGLKVEGEGHDRIRWLDGITDWRTWVWVGSRCWWWTGKPCVLQLVVSQRGGCNWVTELNWLVINFLFSFLWNKLINFLLFLPIVITNHCVYKCIRKYIYIYINKLYIHVVMLLIILGNKKF